MFAHDLPEGTELFGRYRIRRKVSEGSAASVYQAVERTTDALVALKVFDPLRGVDGTARRRFEREYAILGKLHHPGVPRAIEFRAGDDFDVLALEWVEGERLSDRIDRGRFAWPQAAALFADILEVLDVCHRQGVVHRDLKPSNVVLHPDRGPVILDFGVAWLSSAATLTRTGAVVGSVRYLAPELFEGTSVDARADVFSLGAMLYEALTGQPFRRAQSMAELAMASDDRAARPSRVVPGLTPEIDGLVMRAMAHRPEARYATAQEMARALRGGARSPGAAWVDRVRCDACGGLLLADLPFCPGCGGEARWALTPGPYAVQLLEVSEPSAVVRWLSALYGAKRAAGYRWLRRRLANPPVPLAVGLSERSAEALAAGAREAGARAEVVRGRAILGPLLRVPAATPAEIGAASALHVVTVFGLGAGAIAIGLPAGLVFLLPALVAVGGAGAALHYTRRPLVVIDRGAVVERLHPRAVDVQNALKELGTPHARRLAAMAVSRVASLLSGVPEPRERHVSKGAEGTRRAGYAADEEEAWRAFRRALLAATEVDAHARVLAVPAARATEVAVAHDAAVRRALEACATLTDALFPDR